MKKRAKKNNKKYVFDFGTIPGIKIDPALYDGQNMYYDAVETVQVDGNNHYDLIFYDHPAFVHVDSELPLHVNTEDLVLVESCGATSATITPNEPPWNVNTEDLPTQNELPRNLNIENLVPVKSYESTTKMETSNELPLDLRICQNRPFFPLIVSQSDIGSEATTVIEPVSGNTINSNVLYDHHCDQVADRSVNNTTNNCTMMMIDDNDQLQFEPIKCDNAVDLLCLNANQSSPSVIDSLHSQSVQYLKPTKRWPYPCNECPRFFKTKKSFQLHNKLLHECKYKCSKCSLSYNTAAGRQCHVTQKHGTAIKPFVCSMNKCNARFTSAQYLRLHVQNVHKTRYGCTFEKCQKKYLKQESLEQHLEDHQSGAFTQPKCKYDGCGKIYPTAMRLTNHLIRCHKVSH